MFTIYGTILKVLYSNVKAYANLILLQIISSLILKNKIPVPGWDSFKMFLFVCRSAFILSNHATSARYKNFLF